tara:strand:+ start:697 stop:1188 length:492 start_codon:yes stop_codon:yes gene_type:complete
MVDSAQFSNNAYGLLNAGITDTATSVTLQSGNGARFPSLSGSQYFYATLVDASNNLEIVKCTARSSDVLTIAREQEGTTGRAFVSGDRLELRMTAQAILDATSAAVDIDAGTIDLGNTISTGIRVHSATVSSNVTIASTQNGVAAGPLTISATVTVSGDLAIV